MRQLFLRSLLITPVLALIAFAQGAVSPALAQCLPTGVTCGDGIGVPCSCGDTVVTYTRLTGSDPVLRTPCPGVGLFVESWVTLKIHGTIRSEPGNFCSGIALVPGATNVEVTTGRINGFEDGVHAENVTNSLFTGLQVNDCTGSGIHVDGSNNVIKGNVITGCDVRGIEVEGDHNTVSQNRTEEGDRVGIYVDGFQNVVWQNLSQRNGATGIEIFGNENKVNQNRSKYNHGDGFWVANDKNTVTLNLAEGNREDGFRFDGDFNIVERNRSKDNGFEGFVLEFSANKNQLSLNLAERNGFNGFLVQQNSTNNAFLRNIAAGNFGFGIQDTTGGSGDLGTANFYLAGPPPLQAGANRCTSNGMGKSDPPGPIPPNSPPSLCN